MCCGCVFFFGLGFVSVCLCLSFWVGGHKQKWEEKLVANTCAGVCVQVLIINEQHSSNGSSSRAVWATTIGFLLACTW